MVVSEQQALCPELTDYLMALINKGNKNQAEQEEIGKSFHGCCLCVKNDFVKAVISVMGKAGPDSFQLCGCIRNHPQTVAFDRFRVYG